VKLEQSKMGEKETLNKEDEKHRRTLLEYYNSEAMTHGGYIIALTVGLFTLISRWDVFRGDILLKATFYIIVSFGVYLIGKLVYWSIMSHTLLHIREFLVPEGTTRIFALQNTAHDLIATLAKDKKISKWRYYRIVSEFDSLNIPLISSITVIALSMFAIAESMINLGALGILNNLPLLVLVVSVAILVIGLIMLYQKFLS
jgi:hypothetical protein